MVEALRIKEVDQMIESLQKEINRPDITTIKVQSSTPEQAPVTSQPANEVTQTQETPTPTVEVVPVQVTGENTQDTKELERFNTLIAKIKDRNHELGECFTNNIKFISFEDNVLTWESCADEDCKKALKHGYSAIKQLVRELYSFETKIKGIPCSKPIVQVPETSQITQPIMQEPQSISMIEDAEMGGSASCVTNCSDSAQEATKEINGTDITQEPMVQKAIELFEAKKVTVQSKI